MNRGGLFWSKLTYQNIDRFRDWSDLVLNDSQVNGPENEIQEPISDLRQKWMGKSEPRLPCPLRHE